MKTSRKKLTAVLMATMMVVASVFVAPMEADAKEVIVKSPKIIASWEAGDRGDNVMATIYEKADGTYHLQFEGKGDMANGKGPWKGYNYRKKITSVSVLEGITSVGANTLSGTYVNGADFMDVNGLDSLKKIELAEGIERICRCAFAGSKATYIRIPSTVKVIETGAFMHTILNRLTLPASLKKIEYYNFAGRMNVESYVAEAYYPGTKEEYELFGTNNMDRIKEVHFGQKDPAYDEYTLTKYVLDEAGSSITAFVDVESGSYYKDAVAWALDNNITSGTSATTFGSNDACTRSQVMTFLWAANGRKSGGSVSFSDVKQGDYFFNAVSWALEKGVTKGTSASTFGSYDSCTRAQAMVFLWASLGRPAATGKVSFSDVSDNSYYYQAVQWAVEKGVTSGTSKTTFGPNDTCTRAQIITFLYKAQN